MNKINENLDPNWITGFTDAEGCFYINIFKNKNCKNNKIHITAEGLKKIRLIKSRMNINRP